MSTVKIDTSKDDLISTRGDFVMLNSISLASSHLVIVCRKYLAPYLSDIRNETLPIGLGNVLSNKGSVCISFKLGKTRIIVINCHLEAHDENLTKRNE